MIFGKYINKYYLKYFPILFGGILSLILVDYLQLIVPGLYRDIINGMNQGYVVLGSGERVAFDMAYLLDKICLPMIFIVIGIVFGRFAWRICFLGSAVGVETDLRDRMFFHCKDLSQEYYQVHKVGDMMSLFTNDIETVQDCFGWGVMMFCDTMFLGTLAMVKMVKMNWALSLFSLIPMVFLFLIGMVMEKKLTDTWERRQEAFSALSDFSQETFSGIAVIKAYVKEGAELLAFRWLNKKNEKANVEHIRLSTLFNILITLFVESVICVILGYGGYLVYKGEFNAGTLVEFIGYFSAIIWPIMSISELISMHSRGKASLGRISELLKTEPSVTDKPDVVDIEKIKGDIEFKNLNFTYPGSKNEVLHDISFKICAGENVGIIGKTGSGKTTVVDLILRTYNVPDGTLFIDGYDVNSIPIHKVREFSAYVPQDNFLFSDTIENNIAMATDNPQDGDVVKAAKMADIHDNIDEFSEKYNTILGERGVTVSGGQKQRISIARALMKNAPILILDDSVSAVDVKTEKHILENLRLNRQGKTTILIAHRISTIQGMDKIIYIEDGSIAAVGTHKELLDTCAEYRRMVELQKLDDKSEEV